MFIHVRNFFPPNLWCHDLLWFFRANLIFNLVVFLGGRELSFKINVSSLQCHVIFDFGSFFSLPFELTLPANVLLILSRDLERCLHC